ncbi:MAG TPA: hypothetical protein VFQ68_23910 [Streptosporangiaceae bacterium]|nr:hypothetical protein [Streptosporangiaceae bacterium]
MSMSQGPETGSGTPAKVTAMRAIQAALPKRLKEGKIWNPWAATVCENGLDIAKIQGVPGQNSPPETIPDSATFDSIKPVMRKNYQGLYNQFKKEKDADQMVVLTAGNLAEMRDTLKTGYLQWGLVNYKSFTGGMCTNIAAVTVGWLADNTGLIPAGARVEQFNLSSDGQGHAFVVIGRDKDSDPEKLPTWGPDWFIIDQWYARQRITSPGTNAVKDPASASEFHDANFMTFITNGRISKGPSYTIEELKSRLQPPAAVKARSRAPHHYRDHRVT